MPIKVTYSKETQKITKIPQSYDALVNKVSSLFKEKLPKYFLFEYEDKDGEKFRVIDNEDYKSMLETELPHQLHTIKLHIVALDQPLKERDQNQKSKNNSTVLDKELSVKDIAKRFKDKSSSDGKESDNVSGVLALFNDLLSEKLACLEQITCKTDKNSKDTKITINFRKQDDHNAKSRVVIGSDDDEKNENNKKYGHFKWGDIPKRVTKVSKKGDALILSIEWKPRQNGDVPLVSEFTSAELRKYDHEFLIKDFIENSTIRKNTENLKRIKENEADKSKSNKNKKEKKNDYSNEPLVLKKPLVISVILFIIFHLPYSLLES
mgnify:CR=1 FL=1